MVPIDHVGSMLHQNIEYMGEIFVLLYRIPDSKDFSRYLNSLTVTLSRMSLHPQYFWYRTPKDNCCYLVLSVYGGFCRKDAAEIHEVAARLWHELLSPELLYWTHADRSSLPYVLRHLYSVQMTVPEKETYSQVPHTRMFGSSQGLSKT